MATNIKTPTAASKGNAGQAAKKVEKKPEGTNGPAVAGFVLSLCGFFTGITFVVGLILSAVGLSQTKKTGQEGRGLALAGTIIGAIGTGLALIGTVIMVAVFFVFAANSSTIEKAVDHYYDYNCTYEYEYNASTKSYNYVYNCD